MYAMYATVFCRVDRVLAAWQRVIEDGARGDVVVCDVLLQVVNVDVLALVLVLVLVHLAQGSLRVDCSPSFLDHVLYCTCRATHVPIRPGSNRLAMWVHSLAPCVIGPTFFISATHSLAPRRTFNFHSLANPTSIFLSLSSHPFFFFLHPPPCPSVPPSAPPTAPPLPRRASRPVPPPLRLSPLRASTPRPVLWVRVRVSSGKVVYTYVDPFSCARVT